MIKKTSLTIILIYCFAFTIGCSISKNVVKKDEKIISEEKKPIEPSINYSCESVSLLDDKITIAFKKIKINQEEKITKKQYNLVEERTLISGDNKPFGIDATNFSGWCLAMILLPVYLPYRYVESIDRDLGIETGNSTEIINISEQPMNIKNGYIVIEGENIKAPIINGKVIIDVNKFKTKEASYNIKLFENDIEQLSTEIKVEYGDGEKGNTYLIGQKGKLKIEISSLLGLPYAFVATLTNNSSSDIDLNIYSDKLNFILSDGMQVEGEVYFYRSEYFQGNYPDSISANSYIKFNIATKQSVPISDVKQATYKIGSQDLSIQLLPNKDTRTIEKVSILDKTE